VAYVYRPLEYAARAHRAYVDRYGTGRKRVLFLGMNPGPFGMAQTGVPFGDIESVRGWLGIETPIDRPKREHPLRPVLGFDCARSEVSGARLWGLLARRFGTPERFFAEHFIVNYCPLLFLEESGRNRTPDRLGAREREALFAACDRHLARTVELLAPDWVIGIGRFAEDRARAALGEGAPRILRVLHPSPASPAANRGWEEQFAAELGAAGVWSATPGRRASGRAAGGSVASR
jgi:single-strand selective monofunctional uracil DNA glycosylase